MTDREWKKRTRREMAARRETLGEEEVRRRSAAIRDRLMDLPAYRQAGLLMVYVSMRGEVETPPLIAAALQAGKRVAVPVCQPGGTLLPSEIRGLHELAPGTWGILEPAPGNRRPVSPREIDLVVVPGVAFDPFGNRLGFGAGYYDRFLPQLRDGAVTIALAYDFQVLPQVPAEAHDCPVRLVVTESRVLAGGKEVDRRREEEFPRPPVN